MQEKEFKRKIYNKMLQWKNEKNGRSALLIRGARRIGKSTIVQMFARNEYESYILIDFAEAKQEVRNLFNDTSDLDSILLSLQFHYHVTLKERKSVIIFDEVQKCPNARQAIKYLVKDGRYDYIETGSLISIRANTKDIVIPSEETRLDMYPMDYEEFLWAKGDEVTMSLLRQSLATGKSLGESLNRQLMRDFRLYLLVGGMPQAVNELLSTNNLSSVDEVKREIIELYKEDFYKIDSTGRANALFSAIPSQLSMNASRYRPTSVLPNVKEGSMMELLHEMEESRTVNVAYHTTDPNIGISLSKNISCYKLYLSDTGLFVTMAFWDKDFTENVIYEKLLSDKLPANLGYVYENAIAQMLKASGNELCYYTFAKDEKHLYEIDFLVSQGAKISPIEVKSSGYKTHASLDAFRQKYAARIGQSYLIYTKDLITDGSLTYLPAYMTGLI